MKNLTVETIENIQIYRVESSDRYIAISRKEGAIININYMQGCHQDELQYFKDSYLKDDKKLTEFCLNRLNHNTKCEIEEIDRLIWKLIKLEQIQEEAISLIENKVDEAITELHNDNKTESGDITPEQEIKLQDLKEAIALLIAEQVSQNI